VQSDEPAADRQERRETEMSDTIFSTPLLTCATLEDIAAELKRRKLDFFVLFWKEQGEC
jgi:hypothetical protein